MVSNRAVEIMRPVVKALVTDADLTRARAVDAAITPAGDVITEAIHEDALWQRVTWYIPSPVTGTNVAEAFWIPNGGVARLITAYARTAPSSGEFAATVACTGWSGNEGASIQQGVNAGQASRLTKAIDPGSRLTLNITSVSSAAGVTIELFYAPQGGI